MALHVIDVSFNGTRSLWCDLPLAQFDPSLYEHEDVNRLIPWVFMECLFPTPTVEASRASGQDAVSAISAGVADSSDAGDGKDDDDEDPDVDTVALPSEAVGSSAVPLHITATPAKPDVTDNYANFGPLCKTPPSRQAAYSLLATLCNGPDNSNRLLSLLDTVSEVERDDGFLGRETKAWGYDPRALQKPSHQHTGLVNQGATCYLNSFLQQLFHIPTFRSELLSAEDSTGDLTDSVLFQLQVLFGKLQISQKRYCDTRSFCLSFKDYDGTPIRMGEQRVRFSLY
jgi:Ubiquitin carboxyl-terminal hydrolase